MTEIFSEHGSRDGVHLRDGRYQSRCGVMAPAGFADGALYSVYLRAFSAEGTFASVCKRLDEIRALGVSAIWLLPIHPVGREGRKGSAGSPYSILDYRAIDPGYGSFDDLKTLVEAAHDRGLRILIDLVVNHGANDNEWAKSHPASFYRTSGGEPTRRVGGWSDIADWKLDDPEVAEYLLESAVSWVRDAGIDGFRCDVAGMVPRSFWEALRERLNAVRPDHFLLAEWQDPALNTAAFHADYDWLLYRALRDAAKGAGTAEAVAEALHLWNLNFPAEAIPLRFLENHDEPRVLSILEEGRLPAFAATAILSGGLPLIYNGQEAGAVHRPSLFEAEPIDWNRPRATEIRRLYAELLGLRKTSPWSLGKATVLEAAPAKSVLAFERRGPADAGILVANLGVDPVKASVSNMQGRRYRRVWGDGTETWDGDTPLVLGPGGVFAAVVN